MAATVKDGFKIGLGIVLVLVLLPVGTCVACSACATVGAVAGGGYDKGARPAAPAPADRPQVHVARRELLG